MNTSAAFKAGARAALNIKDAPRFGRQATDYISRANPVHRGARGKGFTYETDDGIYFDSQRLDSYGHLAQLRYRGS